MDELDGRASLTSDDPGTNPNHPAEGLQPRPLPCECRVQAHLRLLPSHGFS